MTNEVQDEAPDFEQWLRNYRREQDLRWADYSVARVTMQPVKPRREPPAGFSLSLEKPTWSAPPPIADKAS
jgi:hypothetical protein